MFHFLREKRKGLQHLWETYTRANTQLNSVKYLDDSCTQIRLNKWLQALWYQNIVVSEPVLNMLRAFRTDPHCRSCPGVVWVSFCPGWFLPESLQTRTSRSSSPASSDSAETAVDSHPDHCRWTHWSLQSLHAHTHTQYKTNNTELTSTQTMKQVLTIWPIQVFQRQHEYSWTEYFMQLFEIYKLVKIDRLICCSFFRMIV